MDTSEIVFLRLDDEIPPGFDLDGVLGAAPDLAQYLGIPGDVACAQGSFIYPSTRLAHRANRVFFLSKGTGQFGIGIETPFDPVLGTSVQYPSFEIALRVFLHADPFPGDDMSRNDNGPPIYG